MSRCYFSSGNTAVDAVGKISIKGNVIPNTWYKQITRENGKPYLLAISLLSDIVYWYRPVEVRDEASGNTVGWKKKFKDDLLQKSYQEYADFFGESKRSIKAALDCLEDMGIIKKIFRDYISENKNKIPNIMYIELNPSELERITFEIPEEKNTPSLNPERELDKTNATGNVIDISEEDVIENPDEDSSEFIELSYSGRGLTKECTTPYEEMQDILQNNVGGPTKFCTTPYNKMYHPLQNNVTPPTEFRGTYTYNTTENTTKNTTETTNRNVYSVNQSVRPRTSLKEKLTLIDGLTDRQTDESEAYRRIIRQNIEYDHHMKYDDYGEKELYSEIYGIICEIVCIKRPTVRIEGQDLPYEVVKSRFLKIEENHVLYVMERMKATSTKINNIKAYLLTSLYNAPETINYYYQQDMQYDEYGEGSSRTREVRKNLLRKYGGAI